jgi:hypothetical protein
VTGGSNTYRKRRLCLRPAVGRAADDALPVGVLEPLGDGGTDCVGVSVCSLGGVGEADRAADRGGVVDPVGRGPRAPSHLEFGERRRWRP